MTLNDDFFVLLLLLFLIGPVLLADCGGDFTLETAMIR